MKVELLAVSFGSLKQWLSSHQCCCLAHSGCLTVRHHLILVWCGQTLLHFDGGLTVETKTLKVMRGKNQ